MYQNFKEIRAKRANHCFKYTSSCTRGIYWDTATNNSNKTEMDVEKIIVPNNFLERGKFKFMNNKKMTQSKTTSCVMLILWVEMNRTGSSYYVGHLDEIWYVEIEKITPEIVCKKSNRVSGI